MIGCLGTEDYAPMYLLKIPVAYTYFLPFNLGR